MNKIKVFLQYPWKFPDSPYYKYLLQNHSKNIEYLNAEKPRRGTIANQKKFWLLTRLKVNIRRFFNATKFNLVNSWKTKTKKEFDLIHCAHCLSKNKHKPWVADLEGYWSMFIGNSESKKNKDKVLKILMRKNCKKIMPWTQETYNDIVQNMPSVKHKLEVVYPAIPLNYSKKDNKDNKIRILYATRHFWLKGGVIALEVYKKINEKYGGKVELVFISDVPDEIKKRYPEINIQNLIPNDKLLELYRKSDIFFYPSFVDTFGFGLLEAMSFGIPIISVNTKYTKTRKEIIINKKHGLIVDIENSLTDKILSQKENLQLDEECFILINEIFNKSISLIEDKRMREKMTSNCLKEIRQGKFSIQERNKKIKKIYSEAIQ